jgi:citrate synthase
MHPMTQFVIGISALQTESIFAKQYQEGMPKGKYWDATYEDSLNLIARLPTVAATIYRNTYKDGKLGAVDANLDWSANFAKVGSLFVL